MRIPRAVGVVRAGRHPAIAAFELGETGLIRLGAGEAGVALGADAALDRLARVAATATEHRPRRARHTVCDPWILRAGVPSSSGSRGARATAHRVSSFSPRAGGSSRTDAGSGQGDARRDRWEEAMADMNAPDRMSIASSTSAPQASSRAPMVEWSQVSRSLAASLICGVLAAACGGSSSTATTSGTGGHGTGVGGANTGSAGTAGRARRRDWRGR